MSDFLKILEHPEKDKIIGKLVSGESVAKVSEYLKIKYVEKDESHLRISSKILKEFADKYLDQYEFLDKMIEDEKNNKLDKKISESIINNKTWQERLADTVDKEIDLKNKIIQILKMLEIRAEQVFDQIQQKPDNFKGDYVLLKYFELLFTAIEKCDKIVNEKPDQVIQNNINIKVVEQHSAILQDAIRDTLREMDPHASALFLDKLNERLMVLEKPEPEVRRSITIDQVDRMLPISAIEAEFSESFGEESSE